MIELGGVALFLSGCAVGCFATKRRIRKIIDEVQGSGRPPMTHDCAQALIARKGLHIETSVSPKNDVVTAFDRDGDFLVMSTSSEFAHDLLQHYGLTTKDFVYDTDGQVRLK